MNNEAKGATEMDIAEITKLVAEELDQDAVDETVMRGADNLCVARLLAMLVREMELPRPTVIAVMDCYAEEQSDSEQMSADKLHDEIKFMKERLELLAGEQERRARLAKMYDGFRSMLTYVDENNIDRDY